MKLDFTRLWFYSEALFIDVTDYKQIVHCTVTRCRNTNEVYSLTPLKMNSTQTRETLVAVNHCPDTSRLQRKSP